MIGVPKPGQDYLISRLQRTDFRIGPVTVEKRCIEVNGKQIHELRAQEISSSNGISDGRGRELSNYP